MENETKNNDLLGDLYALRAGLSVISQSADKLARAEYENTEIKRNAILERNWKLYYDCSPTHNIKSWKSNCKEFNRLERELSSQKNLENLEDCWTRFEEEDKIREEAFCEWIKTNEAREYFSKGREEQQSKISDSKEIVKEKKILVSVCVIILFLGIVSAIVGIALISNSIGIALVIAGVLAIILSLLIIKEGLEMLKNGKQYLESYTENFNECNQSLKNIDQCLEIFAQCEYHFEPIVSEIKQNFNILYMELQRTFNRVLDERDWKYLDLIIYYFETGRADDKKEALQLLEREIQTNRIIGTIEEAKQCICTTIENAARMISSRLSSISKKLSEIVSYQQVQIAQNSEIISQTSMQNALIAKSNVTSEKLMNDVNYIKKYGVKIKR